MSKYLLVIHDFMNIVSVPSSLLLVPEELFKVCSTSCHLSATLWACRTPRSVWRGLDGGGWQIPHLQSPQRKWPFQHWWIRQGGSMLLKHTWGGVLNCFVKSYSWLPGTQMLYHQNPPVRPTLQVLQVLQCRASWQFTSTPGHCRRNWTMELCLYHTASISPVQPSLLPLLISSPIPRASLTPPMLPSLHSSHREAISGPLLSRVYAA